MDTSNVLSRQGRRLLQSGVGLFLFTSFWGFAFPQLASPRLGLSVHTLCSLLAVLFIAMGLLLKIVAYSSGPTGILSFALILWGLRTADS
jgi:hypothetical protein